MLSTARIPLAWLNLTHNKRRFVVAVAGITLAVLLMFMQLGFWNALLDSVVALLDHFKTELVIVSRLKYSFMVNEPFPRSRLAQAQAIDGVEGAYPFYLEYRFSLWKNPGRETGSEAQSEAATASPSREEDPQLAGNRPIRVLAFNPADDILTIPQVQEHAATLQLPDTVLMDEKSKAFFGVRRAGLERELANRKVQVVGTFRLGTDFTAEGTLIMSERNFAKFFPNKVTPNATLAKVQIGLVKLTPEGARDVSRVKQALEEALPGDVKVYTREEFADTERGFWMRATPMGPIFGLGVIMGFIVGVVICYQVLSADVADHLPEYATLKAIGYHNRKLTTVVLQEGLLLAVLGFVPGLILSKILYSVLEGLTGLPLILTLTRGIMVLALTIGMCIISGMIAMRKVRTADPAEVF
jgi:putative ABC transport system permease protein